MKKPPKMIRKPEVIARTALSGSTIDNRENPMHRSYDPLFPKRRPLTRSETGRGRAVGWPEDQIDEWISALQGKD